MTNNNSDPLCTCGHAKSEHGPDDDSVCKAKRAGSGIHYADDCYGFVLFEDHTRPASFGSAEHDSPRDPLNVDWLMKQAEKVTDKTAQSIWVLAATIAAAVKELKK